METQRAVTTSHLKLTMSSGRVVALKSLKQWAAHAGLLEGLPTRQRNDAELARLVADARAQYGHEPVLITPTQRRIDYTGRYPFGEPAALPAVGCIARLHSHEPARDRSKDYSDLTVIWFQNDYAFPLDEEVERRILAIDWETIACDREH